MFTILINLVFIVSQVGYDIYHSMFYDNFSVLFTGLIAVALFLKANFERNSYRESFGWYSAFFAFEAVNLMLILVDHSVNKC